MQRILLILLAIYVVMSIISYILFWRDKRIAQRNARRLKEVSRIPERTLHASELLFGWPGSLIAQRTLRHKNAKRPYQIIFWTIVVLHIIGWGVGLGIFYF